MARNNEPVWPHWEEEQIKGSSDPQVHLQGRDMGLRDKERTRGMHSQVGLVKTWSHPLLSGQATVSPARWSSVVRTMNLFPETQFPDLTNTRLSLFFLTA